MSQGERTLQVLEKLLRKAEEDLQPIAAGFAITNRCNLSCRICYVPWHDKAELTTKQAIDVLHGLNRLGTLFLTFTGGEPFLRPDILDLLETGRRLGFAVKVLTNATLLTDRHIEVLSSMDLVSMHVTVFSTRHEVHDAMTGVQGSLSRTMSRLDALSNRGVNLVLHTPLTRFNHEYRGEVERLAKKLGAGWIMDPFLVPRLDGSGDIDKERLDPHALQEVLRKTDTSVGSCSAVEPGRGVAACAAGRRLVFVDPDGTVRPCVQDPRSAGNLLETNLEEIWRSSALLRTLRALRDKDLHEPCASCEKKAFCHRCPAVSLLEGGDYLGPAESTCIAATARMKGEL